MKLVTNVIATYVTYMVIGAGLMLGLKTGQTVYENGLGDKVKNVSKKLLQGK